ncbi:MAG: topoisomerase C-terminal repeat-containing protein, partial [Synechocystis sp.]|nr:topoisomerase C-terminal repeat-containing protein [Synechocystis sp.]
RTLGEHPDTGKKVKASLGRFGPYVVHDQGKDGKDYRSIKGEDDVLSITLERALALLAEPKKGRGRGSKTPLKELGLHPDDQEPVNIFSGPYGNYIKHGTVNASLPEGETVETMTLDKALPLLAEKAATQKTTRKKSTAATTPKKTTAKTTTKKTTTKKASTTKRAASSSKKASS